MTDTIDDVAAKAAEQEPVEPAFDEQGVAEQSKGPGDQANRRTPPPRTARSGSQRLVAPPI